MNFFIPVQTCYLKHFAEGKNEVSFVSRLHTFFFATQHSVNDRETYFLSAPVIKKFLQFCLSIRILLLLLVLTKFFYGGHNYKRTPIEM